MERRRSAQVTSLLTRFSSSITPSSVYGLSICPNRKLCDCHYSNVVQFLHVKPLKISRSSHVRIFQFPKLPVSSLSISFLLAIASPAGPLRARRTGNLGSTTIAFDGIAFPDTANGGLVGMYLGTALPTIPTSSG